LPATLAENFDELVGSAACLLLGVLYLAVGRPEHRFVLDDALMSLVHAAEFTQSRSPRGPDTPAALSAGRVSGNSTGGWGSTRRESGWGPSTTIRASGLASGSSSPTPRPGSRSRTTAYRGTPSGLRNSRAHPLQVPLRVDACEQVGVELDHCCVELGERLVELE